MLIGISIVILCLFILSSAEADIYGFYADRYGKQHACFFDLDETDEELLKGTPYLDIGFFANYGLCKTADGKTEFTLGYYSKEATELGHIRLVDGRWPETQEEIVLSESLVRYSSEEPSIGDVISVSIQGKELKLTITGIMGSLDSWETSYVDPVQAGYNDYPNGVISSRDDLKYTSNYLIYDNATTAERFFLDISALYRTLGQNRDSLMAINQNLYVTVYEGILHVFTSFKRTIVFVLLISLSLIMVTVLNSTLDSYSESIRRYTRLGASDIFILKVLNRDVGLALISSLAGAVIPLSFVLSKTSLLLCIVILTICFVVFNFLAVLKLKSSKVKSIHTKQEIHFRSSVSDLIYNIFGKSNTLRMIPNIIIIAIIISGVVLYGFYSAEMTTIFDMTDYDFYLVNATGGYNYLDGFLHHNQRTMSMSPREAVELYSLDGIKKVMIDNMNDLNIVADVYPSLYWNQFMLVRHPKGSSEAVFKVEGMRTEDYMTISEFTIIIVTDELGQTLKQKYQGFPYEEMKKNKSVCMYAPPVNYGEGTVQEDLFCKLREITFGRVEETLIADPSIIKEGYGLKYSEYTYPVEKIYSESIDDLDPIYYPSNPLIFIAEETNTITDLIKEVTAVEVFLEGTFTEDEYSGVYSAMIDISRTAKNTVFISKKDREEQTDALMRSVKKALSIVMMSFGLFSLAAMCIVIYANIMNKARSFGILRSLGLAKKDMFISFMKETSLYALAIVLLSAIMSLVVFDRIWLLPNLSAPHFYGTEVMAILIYAGVMLLVPAILSIVISSDLYKKGVAETIRFSE